VTYKSYYQSIPVQATQKGLNNCEISHNKSKAKRETSNPITESKKQTPNHGGK